jgi:hypothetical protein
MKNIEITEWRDLRGRIKTTNVVPAYTPKTIEQQMLIYVDAFASPSTKRLYIYSKEVGAWMYVALT